MAFSIDVVELTDRIRRFTPDAIKRLFTEDLSTSERLLEVQQDFANEEHPIHPQIVAERLGSILRDVLAEYRHLPAGDFDQLVSGLVSDLNARLGGVVVVYDQLAINLHNVSKILIGCEPPLEVLEDRRDLRRTLVVELQMVNEVILVNSRPHFFDRIKELLRREGAAVDVIERLRLQPTKLPPAQPLIAFHKHAGHCSVAVGSVIPKVLSGTNGGFTLCARLPVDWLKWVDPSFAPQAISRLTEVDST